LNYSDAVYSSDFYDYFSIRFWGCEAKVCSIINYCGRLDIKSLEEILLNSLQICGHLNGWDSFGRLQVLWEELHRPPVGEAKLELDLKKLKPPPEELRPTETSVPDQIPLKRSIDNVSPSEEVISQVSSKRRI
jgi:hypothetical protein